MAEKVEGHYIYENRGLKEIENSLGRKTPKFTI